MKGQVHPQAFDPDTVNQTKDKNPKIAIISIICSLVFCTKSQEVRNTDWKYRQLFIRERII